MDNERVSQAVYKDLPAPLGAADIDSIILTGSHAHGTVIDDNDVDVTCVINVASGPALFGFNPFVSKKVSVPSKDGAIEISYISIRRLIELLVKSRISSLEILYSPLSVYLKAGEAMASIQGKKDIFIARQIGPSFMEYAEGQLIAMDKARPNGTNSKRSMALTQYGYDTKAAAHALRALWMCIELFKFGYFHVDRTGIDASLIKEIKKGSVTLDAVTSMVLTAQRNAKFYWERSAEGLLQERPDAEAAEELLVEISMQSCVERYFSWIFSRGFTSGIVPGINRAQEAAENLVSQGYRYSQSHGLDEKSINTAVYPYTGAYLQESTDIGVGKMEKSDNVGGSFIDAPPDTLEIASTLPGVQKSEQSAGGSWSELAFHDDKGVGKKSDETGWGLELNH